MYYADGIVALGYITLFAAAFPAGPIISLIANYVEIRSKIYAYLYIFRRTNCVRGVGIGKWIDIWELITLTSIVIKEECCCFHFIKKKKIQYYQSYLIILNST